MRLIIDLALASVILMTGMARAETPNVAVASNFLAPMKRIVEKYEQKYGGKVIISHGSTGQIYTQISNGAPYDLFFSADAERPEKLEMEGMAESGSRFTYAIGVLALYGKKGGVADYGVETLKKGGFRKIAIANPKSAPYGAAAKQVLEKLGLWEKYKPSLVTGENVTQTFLFVKSGGADIGFVALSDAKVSEKADGGYWIVDKSLYKPISQQAVLLKRAIGNKRAKEFMEFVRSVEIKALIVEYGYDLP
ncbi:MAG: molybdate ABC transporter substrate-binding protein [Nitrospinae bacterium]|nr:molybdate ABC transporter substrate-binding protein [Nitrospinota bacterium]